MEVMNTQEIETTTVDPKRKRQRGVTSVEYAVMLVLVALAILGIGNSFSGAVKNVFTSLSTNLK